ncbi:MAG: RES family NAD+ phosphorylase [Proteobacteria bacterium]|uniref:RES family NAD+ phosphorylase n=1 Tax=Aquabacterium sp. TaxID=1872578 RepID=UPI0035C7305C|nr:RES family NAD+ phosphorylase [Pseudomonadota bacterium]
MSLLCCPNCFGDRGLARQIFPTFDPPVGDCGFCGSKGVSVLAPAELSEYFGLLIEVYEPDPHGKKLVEWLKEDWRLFDHPSMDVAHAKELLSEILDDGDLVRRDFSPSGIHASEGLAQWDSLRDELMYRNRYFLDHTLDKKRLEELLNHLVADELPDIWYRARILAADKPYDLDEMGAPPNKLASHGRANPTGIPYLYLGSKPETAVAEVRPHTGEAASVAVFSISGPLTMVDLRDPRKHVSPFFLEDAAEVAKLRADIPFLERLGQELTRPVLPRSAAIDYIPSQYVCEFIKKTGFDGVIYRSSVSDGMNVALFDPSKAVARSVSTYSVRRVTVDVGEAA